MNFRPANLFSTTILVFVYLLFRFSVISIPLQ